MNQFNTFITEREWFRIKFYNRIFKEFFKNYVIVVSNWGYDENSKRAREKKGIDENFIKKYLMHEFHRRGFNVDEYNIVFLDFSNKVESSAKRKMDFYEKEKLYDCMLKMKKLDLMENLAL